MREAVTTCRGFYIIHVEILISSTIKIIAVTLTLISFSSSDISFNLAISNKIDLRNLWISEVTWWIHPGHNSQWHLAFCFPFFNQQNKEKRIPLSLEILTRHWNSFPLLYSSLSHEEITTWVCESLSGSRAQPGLANTHLSQSLFSTHPSMQNTHDEDLNLWGLNPSSDEILSNNMILLFTASYDTDIIAQIYNE